MKVLVLDNYDSFTFNLVQYLGELGADPVTIRNDVMAPDEAAQVHQPDRVVISPGPGRPENAGYSVDYVRAFGQHTPVLGVCLGHQAVIVAYGGTVGAAPEPRHGKVSEISHDGTGVFRGLENPFTATRYHSLPLHHYQTTSMPRPVARTVSSRPFATRRSRSSVSSSTPRAL